MSALWRIVLMRFWRSLSGILACNPKPLPHVEGLCMLGGLCISAFVVVCGRCIVHRLCSTTCKLPCLATLCDRYQASMLEISKGRALNRCPQTAEHSQTKRSFEGLKGNFSHEEKFPFNFARNAFLSPQICR